MHIGTPKSGTTYLQSRMEANRERAAEQGLLWPGPRWGAHVEAARDLRQLQPGDQLSPDGPWMRLVRQVHRWSGSSALISMEWLAGCTNKQVRAGVQSLAPARVEVVCTTRDLLRMFVAQWQEMTKNCRPWPWRQFVDEMMSEVVDEVQTPSAFRFWTQQNVPKIIRRWGQYVPEDAIHLVTVPPQGANPEILWDRFCAVLGIDGTAFEQPERRNESIGVVSASLMHRVNLAALAEDLSKVEYQRVLHRRFADEILAPYRDREAAIAVSPETDAWIRSRSEQLVAEIATLPVKVTGDLQDLIPGPPLEGRQPDEVTDSELLDTCVEALVKFAMAEHAVARQLREENRALRQRLAAKAGKARRQATMPGAAGRERAGAGRDDTSTPTRFDADRSVARRAKRLARRGRAKLSRVVRGHPDDPAR